MLPTPSVNILSKLLPEHLSSPRHHPHLFPLWVTAMPVSTAQVVQPCQRRYACPHPPTQFPPLCPFQDAIAALRSFIEYQTKNASLQTSKKNQMLSLEVRARVVVMGVMWRGFGWMGADVVTLPFAAWGIGLVMIGSKLSHEDDPLYRGSLLRHVRDPKMMAIFLVFWCTFPAH